MRKYNENGFVNYEVSNGYRVLVGMMEQEIYDNHESKWGYVPSRFSISVDNGCGLALGNKGIKTIEELKKEIDRIAFLTEDEKEFLKSIN